MSGRGSLSSLPLVPSSFDEAVVSQNGLEADGSPALEPGVAEDSNSGVTQSRSWVRNNLAQAGVIAAIIAAAGFTGVRACNHGTGGTDDDTVSTQPVQSAIQP